MTHRNNWARLRKLEEHARGLNSGTTCSVMDSTVRVVRGRESWVEEFTTAYDALTWTHERATQDGWTVFSLCISDIADALPRPFDRLMDFALVEGEGRVVGDLGTNRLYSDNAQPPPLWWYTLHKWFHGPNGQRSLDEVWTGRDSRDSGNQLMPALNLRNPVGVLALVTLADLLSVPLHWVEPAFSMGPEQRALYQSWLAADTAGARFATSQEAYHG